MEEIWLETLRPLILFIGPISVVAVTRMIPIMGDMQESLSIFTTSIQMMPHIQVHLHAAGGVMVVAVVAVSRLYLAIDVISMVGMIVACLIAVIFLTILLCIQAEDVFKQAEVFVT